MRITIDTNLNRVIVPDSFFNQIDKMNAMLKATNPDAKPIDYVEYLKKAIESATKSAPVRKSDVPNLKRGWYG